MAATKHIAVDEETHAGVQELMYRLRATSRAEVVQKLVKEALASTSTSSGPGRFRARA